MSRGSNPALLWSGARAGTAPPPPPPPPPAGNALMADTFNESFGVNYHANFGAGTEIPSYNFGASDAWHNAGIDHIGAMGCRYIRDKMPTSTSLTHQVNALYQRYATNFGGKVSATLGAVRGNGDTMAEANALVNSYLNAVQALGGAGGGIFAAFQGINEPNNDGAKTSVWAPETQNLQTALWQQAKARNTGSTRTDTIPILGPGLARRIDGTWPDTTAADYAALGDLSGVCDVGNVHIYPAGKEAGLFIPDFVVMARGNYPAPMPIQCTEGGYFDAMSYTGGSDPTPEDVNAVYVIRQILEHMILGHTRFFDYQSLDGPNVGNDSREDNFGFIDVRTTDPSTWRRKAKWYAMKRMLSLMADPGSPFTVTAPAVTITTQASAFKHLMFQKRSGKAYLVMWRDVKLYTQKKKNGHYLGGSYNVIDDAPVTVTLPTALPIALHKPSSQGSALTSTPFPVLSARTSFTTTVAGEVVVAEIG